MSKAVKYKKPAEMCKYKRCRRNKASWSAFCIGHLHKERRPFRKY